MPCRHQDRCGGASPRLVAALAELEYDLFWETSTFYGPNNYYRAGRSSAVQLATAGHTVFVSVNLLAIPRGYDASQVSPFTLGLVSNLTPVDASLPLLSSYSPVRVLDFLTGRLVVEVGMADSIPGALLQQPPGFVEVINFVLSQT